MPTQSTKKWVLIRADASPEIGYGHIMRCSALAKRLAAQGFVCMFVARSIPVTLKQSVSQQGHKFIKLPQANLPPPSKEEGEYGLWLGTDELSDAKAVKQAINPITKASGNPDMIIVDHYGLSAIWEGAMIDAMPVPVLAIDDLSNRAHDCDILLDTTFGKSPQSYKALVPDRCELLVGAEYALLRPEFAQARPAALLCRDRGFAKSQSIKTLCISMGGMDQDNVSLGMIKAAEALEDTPSFKIEVLVGKDCVHLETLQIYAEHSSLDITVHGGIESVADLYARADLCIGAAGSSTWERCCLGLPTINVTIAENQEIITKNLSESGSVAPGGNFKNIDPKEFAKDILLPLIKSNESRQSLSLASRKICDGYGLDRMALALRTREVKLGKIVRLRFANEDDIRQVYEWQRLPETRKFANNTEPPSWDQHRDWMINKLMRPQDYFYIIRCGGGDAGVLRLDLDLDRGPNVHVVSIFIDPAYFGLGSASAALSLLAEFHEEKQIWAQVHDENAASIALFTRSGYVKKHGDWYMLSCGAG